NPDQRISEDVKTFTATTLSFLILLFNAAVTFLAFASVLWSITPWLFVVAVVYAVLGSLGTLLLGHRLVALDNQQLRKEADFRFALGRLREHGPAVAQMGGEPAEKGRLGERLAAPRGWNDCTRRWPGPASPTSAPTGRRWSPATTCGW